MFHLDSFPIEQAVVCLKEQHFSIGCGQDNVKNTITIQIVLHKG